ncbi:MAG: ABC transporter permease, partial [Candidatus Limnocylindrales bacterium]
MAVTTSRPEPRGTRWPALRVFEHHLLVYRRTWRGTLFTTFLSPVLFLTAMGLGLGRLVDASNPQGLIAGASYLAFLAPGLLASTAMQTAAFESTYPIMAGMVWLKTYDAMISTPIKPRNVVFGQLMWVTTRLTIGTSVFMAVVFIFGAATFPSGLMAVPFAVMTGLAFAAPIQAFAATQKNDTVFNAIFRFGITPLFIFSGTFFPVEQLPAVIQP